jgi:hypothetical protein
VCPESLEKPRRKRREVVALGHKSPPFLQTAQKEWGTLEANGEIGAGLTWRPASEGGPYKNRKSRAQSEGYATWAKRD